MSLQPSIQAFRSENLRLLLEGARRDEAAFAPSMPALKRAFGATVDREIARYCRRARFARTTQGFLPTPIFSSHLRSNALPYVIWVALQIPTTIAFQNAWATFARTPLLRARYVGVHTKWRRLIRGMYCELIGTRLGQSRPLRQGYVASLLGLVLLPLSLAVSTLANSKENSGYLVAVTLGFFYYALAMTALGWAGRPKRLRADLEAFGHICNLLTMVPFIRDARVAGPQILVVTMLGNLADCLQVRYPRFVGLNVEARDAIALSGFDRLASDVRTWQALAAAPTVQVTERLNRDLSMLGAAIATRRLGEIRPSTSVEDAQARAETRASIQVTRILVRLAVALIPGALYLVAKYGLHLDLSAAVEAAWVPLSLGWALTNILAIFPDYKDRVDATTGLVGLLSPGKKS